MEHLTKTPAGPGDERHDAGLLAALSEIQGLLQFDMRGVVCGANQIALDLFGYRQDELLGQHHDVLCLPSHRRTDAGLELWRLLTEGRSQSGKYRRADRQGREVWVHAHYIALSGNGGPADHVIALFDDISTDVSTQVDIS